MDKSEKNSQEDRFSVILQENTGSQNIPGEYQNQTLNQWQTRTNSTDTTLKSIFMSIDNKGIIWKLRIFVLTEEK